MNNKEHKEYLAAFKKYSTKVSSSKKKSRQFLVRSGIHDASGTLNKVYIVSK
jgi:hypothetical protein